ncbi:hypothetical protein [Domibacillus tundrae]|uniref:hypothetical protein n=1 Tax=Domibacillus tundrae TaxID=1587527 RepID=UPI000B151F4F|nr:hypothetical protein [Domibacillus tundrae]
MEYTLEWIEDQFEQRRFLEDALNYFYQIKHDTFTFNELVQQINELKTNYLEEEFENS